MNTAATSLHPPPASSLSPAISPDPNTTHRFKRVTDEGKGGGGADRGGQPVAEEEEGDDEGVKGERTERQDLERAQSGGEREAGEGERADEEAARGSAGGWGSIKVSYYPSIHVLCGVW